MRFYTNAGLVVAVGIGLSAAGALAQQTSPQPGEKPAQKVMPAKDSAEADISGPADESGGRQAERASGSPSSAATAPLPPGTVAIVPGADPGSVLAEARARGDARLLADDYGDPLVEAIAGGRPYDVTFYDCTANVDCQSVMLRAAFRADGHTAEEMATWNRSERFGKAYLDVEGNPTVEMNLNLSGGVTRENLSDSFDRWIDVLSDFAGNAGY